MRPKDILAILGVAAATMAFTVTLFGPGQVNAVEEIEGTKVMLKNPELTLDGCTFSLTADRQAYQPGETPVLQIVATNPTDQEVETTVWANMTAQSPASMYSRVMVMPQPVWTGKQLVKLAPGETKTISLATETTVPEGQMVSITLGNQNLEILAQNFAVPRQVESLQIVLGNQANQTAEADEAGE